MNLSPDLLGVGVPDRPGDLDLEGVFEGVFFTRTTSDPVLLEGVVFVEVDSLEELELQEFSSPFLCQRARGPLVRGPSMFSRLVISFRYLNWAISRVAMAFKEKLSVTI